MNNFSCLVLGLFSTLIIYKVRISVQLIELLQFLIVRSHRDSDGGGNVPCG
jgi:hypothetical protein